MGRQFTLALEGAGSHVLVCGRRKAPLIETESMASGAGQIEHVCADLHIEEERRAMLARAGPIDILVNNAARWTREPWNRFSLQAWRHDMAINVEVPLVLMQEFVPGMMARGWGRVVNIGSIYSVVAGNPAHYPGLGLDTASYFSSKHALVGLSKYVAVMCAPDGVTVNVLSPGHFPVGPSPGDTTIEPEDSKRIWERLAEHTPCGRVGRDGELSGALLFMVSDSAAYLTGQNIIVDGGWTVW